MTPDDWYFIEIHFANLRAQRDLQRMELLAMYHRVYIAMQALAPEKPKRPQYWQKNKRNFLNPRRSE